MSAGGLGADSVGARSADGAAAWPGSQKRSARSHDRRSGVNAPRIAGRKLRIDERCAEYEAGAAGQLAEAAACRGARHVGVSKT